MVEVGKEPKVAEGSNGLLTIVGPALLRKGEGE